MAEIEHRLEVEIIEWQKRMQEYLVEVALQQQQQLLLQQQQQQQNGAQQQQLLNEVDENHDHQDQGINFAVEEVVRQ